MQQTNSRKRTMKFLVDVGESYESGRVVEVEATDANQAYGIVSRVCYGYEFIQQIFDMDGHCYYDFMNGFALYEDQKS